MSKNKHLEHLEDDILNNGSEGGKTSIAFLRSLGSMLSEGDKNNVKVTTKWDGAPAIVCGIDPVTQYFFVGNKSVDPLLLDQHFFLSLLNIWREQIRQALFQ